MDSLDWGQAAEFALFTKSLQAIRDLDSLGWLLFYSIM